MLLILKVSISLDYLIYSPHIWRTYFSVLSDPVVNLAWIMPAIDFLKQAKICKDTSWSSAHARSAVDKYFLTIGHHVVYFASPIKKLIQEVIMIKVCDREMDSFHSTL